MQILGWDELTNDQRTQAGLLDWSDWESPGQTQLLHEPWVHGRPYQDYSSLVVVERGRPLARVGVIRVALRDHEGTVPVLGVSDVITDPSELRRGLATRLMVEAHARARADGISTSFLSTRRSWGAHRGYEKLGYADVFSVRLALRAIPRPARTTSDERVRVRRGRKSDVRTYQRILDAASVGRVGFIPRSKGSFDVRLRLRWSDPKDYLVVSKGGETVGYALTRTGLREVTCREAVPARPEFRGALLDGVERYARGKLLAFGTTTFLSDAASEFARRGYHRRDRGHWVLMAHALRGSASSELGRLRSLFQDPALFLHQPDTF